MKEIDEILQAAANHPNSRVSKLIRTVEEEPSQKNIVLLLIELADHSEYITDFRISLKYYLNLFEHLGIGRNIVLNETGVLLINSSKIYARRVDYMQELVEHQILTLSSAEHEKESASKNDEHSSTNPAAGKPKRSRKRLLKTTIDPYELELIPKKFRKLNNEKRFSTAKQPAVKTTHQRNIEQEQYVHPAAWVHSSIVDLDNEEEIDSKRNYKLFTYHVEHRYNTLVPDINFRLHFKVKDYIDEEEERMEEESENCGSAYADRVWPPLSEEYIEKYINLENYVLEEDIMPQRKRLRIEEVTRKKHSRRKSGHDNNVDMADNSETSTLPTNALDEVQTSLDTTLNTQNLNPNNETVQNDSGLGQSLLDNSNILNDGDANNTNIENAANSTALANGTLLSNNESTLSASTLEKSADESTIQIDSAIGESTLSLNQTENTSNTEAPVETGNLSNQDTAENTDEFNLNDIRILMPGLDDEGVYFSDLDEQEQMKLTPNVVFVDYFASIPNKKGITIILNDDMKAMLNINDDEPPITYELPATMNSNAYPPLSLNIFKISEKLLRRRNLFKLGPDMDLFLKARALKRPRSAAGVCEPRQSRTTQWFPLNSTDMTGVKMTPPHSSGDNSDFYGFSDDEETTNLLGCTNQEQCSVNDVNTHRLMSSDSGVSVDVTPLQEHEKTAENLNTSASDCNEKSNQENEASLINKITEGTDYCQVTEKVPNETAAESSAVETFNEPQKNEDDDVFDDTALANLTTENESEIELMDLDLQSNKTKIQKWHEHLQPILAKSRERHHFDVFQIGTEIIEQIQNPAPNGTTHSSNTQNTTFQNVMENKDESYVSRYFLSSLLLANQSNIKITINNKSAEHPSAWSDIQLDLLSTKRHTVAIEDNIGLLNTKLLSPTKNLKKKAAAATNANISTTTTTTATKNHNVNRLQLDSESVNVNLNVVKPLKQIEKLPHNSDDYDSGIFSSEEFTL